MMKHCRLQKGEGNSDPLCGKVKRGEMKKAMMV
jgi:hypothetical protein